MLMLDLYLNRRCGNTASVLELDENLNSTYKTFDAAAQVRFDRGPQSASGSSLEP